VSIPADFDISNAKKAWPKRRRSASPLLVHVSLSDEAAVLGVGGGGVTTLLRVGKGEMEAFNLVAGSKLRAFVAEVRPGGAPGASSASTTASSGGDGPIDAAAVDAATKPPPPPQATQTATLILSCSRSYARGRGTAPASNKKPAAAAAPPSSALAGSGATDSRGPAPVGALLLSSLSPGDALSNCQVVKVLPSGALFASCGVVRPGKGGVWANVDGFVFPGDLGDRAVNVWRVACPSSCACCFCWFACVRCVACVAFFFVFVLFASFASFIFIFLRWLFVCLFVGDQSGCFF
jgi:hypothetical protein